MINAPSSARSFACGSATCTSPQFCVLDAGAGGTCETPPSTCPTPPTCACLEDACAPSSVATCNFQHIGDAQVPFIQCK